MQTVKTILSLQTKLKQYKSKTIGFVPTMGALHEGHLSLVRKCRRENDITIVSIFVNPTQFGPKEDFGKYLRAEKKDKLLLKKEKVDIIFYPTAEEIYPAGYLTYVEVNALGTRLCGKQRPTHFKGVTTVVNKLLNIVKPTTLYLGQKDAQQALIIKKMVADLNMPVKVKVCTTVREKDGLALSSRNVYLNTNQRREAVVLYKSLKEAKYRIKKGERSSSRIKQFIQNAIQRGTSGKIDYIEVVDPNTLAPLKKLTKAIMIALAVKFGKARLIDNIIFKV